MNAATSLPLRSHLWLNHKNHFNEHPFVLRHVVGAIKTFLLNLLAASQNQNIDVDVGVDLPWWLESWNGFEKYDS